MSPFFAFLLLILLSLFVAIYALSVLFSKAVFKAWVKGSGAFIALSIALVVFGLALALLGYSMNGESEQIAVVKSSRVADQKFTIRIEQEGLVPTDYEVHGDQWQIDARIISWQGWWRYFGLDTSYKLERLSGRYADIEQESTSSRSLYSLEANHTLSWFDQFLVWLDKYQMLPGFDAKYGGGVYVPMADAAEYELLIDDGGLKVKPLNAVAQSTISGWR